MNIKFQLKPLESENQNAPLLTGLTPAQYAAVTHITGPTLVIAGAGSGKTKTIVHRVAYLMSQGIAPESILLLTFTRKSAQEMLRRAASLASSRARQVTGGTFHSFAHDILRQHAPLLGYSPQFSILDRSDAEDLIGQIRKQTITAIQTQRFPQKGTLAAMIGKSVNKAVSIPQILKEDYSQFQPLKSEIEQIAKQYQAKKQSIDAMDYDDLLLNLLRLLDEHDDIAQHYQNRFVHIMVDEYQDTNIIQAAIIQLLAGPQPNLFVVGDDAQSIYSFRGANFQNIIQFPNQFPNTKTIVLDQNFRSTQPILNLTNAMIAQAKEKYQKALHSELPGNTKPAYIETPDDNTQSQFICQKILEFRETGIKLNEIAVLFRSSWHSNDIEVALNAANIPFVKFGGIKFAQAAHVKDLIAFARVLTNRRDSLSWQRMLQLIDGIGPKTADQLIAILQSDRAFDALGNIIQGKKYESELQKWAQTFKTVSKYTRPTEILSALFELYKPYFELKYDDHIKRLPDIESLKTIAERYESLTQFLAEISLDPPDSSQTDAINQTESEEKLTLSTIHSAKGLEWKVVFVISVIDGYLPSLQSLNHPEDIEEERRLLYVALTRAKQHLFILKPNLDLPVSGNYGFGGRQFAKVSRFLEGRILIENTDRWTLVEPQAPSQKDTAATIFSDEFPDTTPQRRSYYF